MSVLPMLRILVSVTLFVAPQAVGQEDAERPVNNSPLVNAADLHTLFFTPQHASLGRLADVAERLYGRQIYVREHGGYQSRPVQNLSYLGDSLLIHETPEQGALLLQALGKLDAQVGAAHVDTQPAFVVAHWTPKHVSLKTAAAALAVFQRRVTVSAGVGHGSEHANISLASERKLIVLRDTPELVETMLATLEQVDQPEPQLLLTCLVIQGVRGPAQDPSTIPAELVQHLGQLVPYEHFELRSLGMVRASALSREIELSMDDAYFLQLEPESYDPEAGALSALSQFRSDGASFQTRTSIAASEYTVLGATGEEPIFVVLKIEAVGA